MSPDIDSYLLKEVIVSLICLLLSGYIFRQFDLSTIRWHSLARLLLFIATLGTFAHITITLLFENTLSSDPSLMATYPVIITIICFFAFVLYVLNAELETAPADRVECKGYFASLLFFIYFMPLSIYLHYSIQTSQLKLMNRRGPTFNADMKVDTWPHFSIDYKIISLGILIILTLSATHWLFPKIAYANQHLPQKGLKGTRFSAKSILVLYIIMLLLFMDLLFLVFWGVTIISVLAMPSFHVIFLIGFIRILLSFHLEKDSPKQNA